MNDNANQSRGAAEVPTTIEEILELYDFVREYDIHYSTVRSAISTFLVTAVFGLDAWIVAHTAEMNLTQVAPRVMWSALAGPIVLLIFTLLISAHFQRLTICCQKIQEKLEEQLDAFHRGDDDFTKYSSAVLFRRGVERLIGTKRVSLRPLSGYSSAMPRRVYASAVRRQHVVLVAGARSVVLFPIQHFTSSRTSR